MCGVAQDALLRVFWLDETIEHLAEHGVTPEEFEEVVSNPEEIGEPIFEPSLLLGRNGRWPLSLLSLRKTG